MERVECPKCGKDMTHRTNIHHKSGKNFAYLCANCGLRIEYNIYDELGKKIDTLREECK